jgi:hypothetical protein
VTRHSEFVRGNEVTLEVYRDGSGPELVAYLPTVGTEDLTSTILRPR